MYTSAFFNTSCLKAWFDVGRSTLLMGVAQQKWRNVGSFTSCPSPGELCDVPDTSIFCCAVWLSSVIPLTCIQGLTDAAVMSAAGQTTFTSLTDSRHLLNRRKEINSAWCLTIHWLFFSAHCSQWGHRLINHLKGCCWFSVGNSSKESSDRP